jgi:hypothetical protein
MTETVVPILVALLVAWLGFRFALTQDHRRWARERRAELYVDLLQEVSAEREWVSAWAVAVATGEPMGADVRDDRMPSLERRRLGARAAAYASPEVVRRWNVANGLGFRIVLGQEGPPLVALARLEVAGRDLEQQVRREFIVDGYPWWKRLRAGRGTAPDESARMKAGEEEWRRRVAEGSAGE